MASLSKALLSSRNRPSPSGGLAKTCPAVWLSRGIAPPPRPQTREPVANDFVRKCLRFIVVSPQFQQCTFQNLGYVASSYQTPLRTRSYRFRYSPQIPHRPALREDEVDPEQTKQSARRSEGLN